MFKSIYIVGSFNRSIINIVYMLIYVYLVCATFPHENRSALQSQSNQNRSPSDVCPHSYSVCGSSRASQIRVQPIMTEATGMFPSSKRTRINWVRLNLRDVPVHHGEINFNLIMI